MKNTSDRWTLGWLMLAVGCAATALFLLFVDVPVGDAKQAKFRGMIESGLSLVRVDLASAAVLALSSMMLWRRGGELPSVRQSEPRLSPGSTYAVIVPMAMFSLLAIPRLGTSLWWDELNTLTRVVLRGPAVILTFSCDANNHIMNSILVWVSLKTLGTSEVAFHLAPFFLSLAVILLIHRTLLRTAGPVAALVGGMMVALHPTFVTQGVEARGYAGAVLFSWLSSVSFAELMTRSSPRLTALYVASCVVAFGFISTTILVPFAHGIVACLVLLAGYRRPEAALYRANSVNLIFACLWVAVLALLLFGFPLPQTLAYARGGAAKQHLSAGWPAARALVTYVSGLRNPWLSALILSLAGLGWWSASRRGSTPWHRWLMVACLTPLVMAGLYALSPGVYTSPRFFCFLILPTCFGTSLAVTRMVRPWPSSRIATGLLISGWLALTAQEQWRLLAINRPDLKTLGAELRGKRVVLIGPQSDVNRYYFPSADSYQEGVDSATLKEALARAEFVVEGRARGNNHLDQPKIELEGLDFHVQRAMPSSIEGDTEYLIYTRRLRTMEAGVN